MLVMEVYSLTLFVAGRTGRSAQAIANLQRLCSGLPDGSCSVTIIDVLEHPEIAEDRRILATPTLIKESPPPARRLIGDLSQAAILMDALGLKD